jgi:hypothetical protein
VPVRIKGCPTSFYAQLDTGSPITVFFANAIKTIDAKACPGTRKKLLRNASPNSMTMSTPVPVAVGAFDVGTRSVAVLSNNEESEYFGDAKQRGLVIGVLGLDAFETKRLLIDFPHERFMILPASADTPSAIADRVTYTSAVVRDAKFYVPVVIRTASGENVSYELNYDTGSSSAYLDVTKPLWSALTGRDGTEPTNTRIAGHGWGSDSMTIVGTHLIGPVSIGAIAIGSAEDYNATITFLDRRTNSESASAKPWFGSLGNAFFYDHYLVIMDIPENRFGLARVEP